MTRVSPLFVLRRRLGAWGAPTLLVVAAFVITRGLAVAATHLGSATMRPEKRAELEYVPGGLRPAPVPPFLEPLQRWDADFYASIAVNGYPGPDAPRRNYHLGFFPLYPLAVRALTPLFGNVYWAAFALSNACALAAALVLLELGAVRRRADGLRSALLFLAAPGANFLSYPYSEALFALALAVGLLAARRERLAVAAAAGIAASSTRAPGLAVAVALATSPGARRLLAAAVAILGTAAFALWCARVYGDPLAFIQVQASHKRVLSVMGPLRALFGFDADPDYYLVTLACIAAACAMVRRTPAWMWVSAWFMLLLPLATGTIQAMIRYQSTNLPLLCGVPMILRGRRYWGTLLASLLLMGLQAVLYGQGQPHF